MGQGWDSGRAGLATDHGIGVEDPPLHPQRERRGGRVLRRVVQGLKPGVAPKLPAEVAEEAIAAVESSWRPIIGQLYDSGVPTDKFSATVDAELLAAVRAHAGPRGVSAFVATALRHELDRVRLRELLDDLSTEIGPPDEAMVAEATRELNALLTVTADGACRAG